MARPEFSRKNIMKNSSNENICRFDFSKEQKFQCTPLNAASPRRRWVTPGDLYPDRRG